MFRIEREEKDHFFYFLGCSKAERTHLTIQPHSLRNAEHTLKYFSSSLTLLVTLTFPRGLEDGKTQPDKTTKKTISNEFLRS